MSAARMCFRFRIYLCATTACSDGENGKNGSTSEIRPANAALLVLVGCGSRDWGVSYSEVDRELLEEFGGDVVGYVCDNTVLRAGVVEGFRIGAVVRLNDVVDLTGCEDPDDLRAVYFCIAPRGAAIAVFSCGEVSGVQRRAWGLNLR